MSRVIVKQPDGNYAVWSSIVDDFIYLNASKDDLIETLAQEAYDDKKARLLESFESRYRTFNECLDTLETVHGKSARIKLESKLKINRKEGK